MYAVHDEICVCVCVFYTREHENAAYFRYYLKNKISLLAAVIVFCPNKNCDGLSRVHTHTHTLVKLYVVRLIFGTNLFCAAENARVFVCGRGVRAV